VLLASYGTDDEAVTVEPAAIDNPEASAPTTSVRRPVTANPSH
jgi:hypothetical protein